MEELLKILEERVKEKYHLHEITQNNYYLYEAMEDRYIIDIIKKRMEEDAKANL